MKQIELFNDHFQNFKVYGIPHAQLIIADPPYNLGKNAYASNPCSDACKVDNVQCLCEAFILEEQFNV